MNIKKIRDFISDILKNISVLILLIFFINLLVISIFQSYQYFQLGSFKSGNRHNLETHSKYDWSEQYFKDEKKVKAEYHPFIGFKEKKFISENINIDEDGYRISRNNSETPDVFFLGGSTMFGYGSNDENTIPSLFSKFINDSLTVRNLGNASHNSTQNLIKIQDELLNFKNPKYIISYEGVNEINNLLKGIKSNYRHGYSLLFKEIIDKNIIKNETLSFYSFFESQTKYLKNFIIISFKKLGFISYKTIYDKYYIDNKSIEKSVEILVNNWKILSFMGKEKNINVFLFLQPELTTNTHKTDYLGEIDVHKDFYEKLYPLIKEKIMNDPSLELVKNNFYDLSKSLDDKEAYFYDHCHLNPSGNRKITNEIIKQIFK